MPKLFSFQMSDENLKNLKELSKNKDMPISKILNSLIATYLANEKDTPKKEELELREEALDNPQQNYKTLRLRITENEYSALSKFAKMESLGTAIRYVKYLIALKIYPNDSKSNQELKALQDLRNELNAIGKNLNIAVKEKLVNNLNASLSNTLEKVITEICNQQENIKYKLDKFYEINKRRF